MQNLKPFDPNDVDETLTRVAVHGRNTYLLFPYINGVGFAPKFDSVSYVIHGTTATVADFAALAGLIRTTAQTAKWFISFNTPWLVRLEDAEEMRQRTNSPRPKRT